MIDTFEQYRPLLFSIAYRMVGTVVSAEDIVQETFLRVNDKQEAEIRNPKAYLCQITTRLCLDHLKSAKTQRELYVGPWLPEPLLTESDDLVEPEKIIGKMDSISMAFMLLMENLSPAERAVFLLKAVFDYSYADIAQILGKDQAACRQLFSRAKRHLSANRPRFEPDEKRHDDLLQSFWQACQTGNTTDIESVLAAEVVVTVDGGGQATAATRPIYGRNRAARYLQGIFKRGLSQAQFKFVQANHQQCILVFNDDEPLALFMISTDETSIQHIQAIRNPQKLTMFTRE